ncbi:prepilin-type N-terminal cleavage/methylation domain-containing protein [Nocardioides sp. J9]|uniref:PulJ/GspJ family protein n=1 Tax=unclassified Nocardioides TaxID=2615069 RepID=UPI0004BB9C89|nr:MULTISPECIES: prepilin-type N-terminal cleavage/methylation domain-containing protein [unclassified Nocardioides]TWG96441.1 prepilin-type N-terminal cleavage/methylation domain-containing protein [Nocardioides sp. J9]
MHAVMNEPTEARARSSRGDAGFTLMELVVTVAIIGIITTALSGVVIAFFKNTAETQARLTESHDVQLAAAYWQRDVASIGTRVTEPEADTGLYPIADWADAVPCGNVPLGYTPVVTLRWGEYQSPDPAVPANVVRVTYAGKSLGDDRFELVRARCGSSPSVVRVANNLKALPEVLCDGGACAPGDPAPRIITMKLTAFDTSERHSGHYTATLTGERRQS